MSRYNYLYRRYGYETFKLNSSVLIEKTSCKNYSISSEKFLNTLGISVYFLLKTKISIQGYEKTFGSIIKNSLSNHENQIEEIYGFDIIAKFYKKITSIEKIQKLPYCYFDYNKASKWGVLMDDSEYSTNRIMSKNGEYVDFKIYCMTRDIEEGAGFKDELPF